MTIPIVFRLSGKQHESLKSHLFPGDNKEAAAFVLCGRRVSQRRHVLTGYKVHPIAYANCSQRTPVRLTWSTKEIPPLLEEASRKDLAVIKIHSHPKPVTDFSALDDESDTDFFNSVYGWMDNQLPHGSAVMLCDGRIFGRMVGPAGDFKDFQSVNIVGDDLQFWFKRDSEEANPPESLRRNAQAFGEGTTRLMQRLSIAVVGCSGTGSPVIEQLARLGVGRLVLIDPDIIEEKNLNRILNSGIEDIGKPKVKVLARAIDRMGFGTQVTTIAKDVFRPNVVKEIAECDAIFGCVDTVEGRHLLNRLATFYLIPYFDVGVRLKADGQGGIDNICGTVNYLQPGGSSLLSRKLYSEENLRAEGMRRTDPKSYAALRREKYISGINEERPAVVSVNMLYASMAVNEFLARIHPFRLDRNGEFAVYRFSLDQGELYKERDGNACPILLKFAGRGDMRPLLDRPELSETGEQS
jgi:hypothetical protein